MPNALWILYFHSIGPIIASPVLSLAIAILIKAYDGGPVFYKQDRLTKDGRVFTDSEVSKYEGAVREEGRPSGYER